MGVLRGCPETALREPPPSTGSSSPPHRGAGPPGTREGGQCQKVVGGGSSPWSEPSEGAWRSRDLVSKSESCWGKANWMQSLGLAGETRDKDRFHLTSRSAKDHSCLSLRMRTKCLPLTPKGFSGGTVGKESACQCRRHFSNGFNPWVRKIPLRRKWQPILAFSPGQSHGQRSLVGYSPWSHKESDTTERARVHTHTHTHAPTGEAASCTLTSLRESTPWSLVRAQLQPSVSCVPMEHQGTSLSLKGFS